MLVVVYDSLTGLGKKFANSLGLPSQSVWKKLEGPCILVSRNSGAGQIPWTTKRFIRKYRHLIKGFVIMVIRSVIRGPFAGQRIR